MWALPVLAAAFVIVICGSPLILFRPARGATTDRIAKTAQAKMDRRPFLSFYLPFSTALVFSAVTAMTYVVGQASLEARITGLSLAMIPLLSSVLLLRFRTWPR